MTLVYRGFGGLLQWLSTTIRYLFFSQRLIEARRMMDKLRACIVANYYASAGLLKAGEVKITLGTVRL